MVLFYSLVQIVPSDTFVSTPGGVATFLCHSIDPSLEIDRVQWLVNGSLFEELDLGLNVTSTFSRDVQVGRLEFSNLPLEYNMTRIQCRVNRILISNGVTLLLIQG